MRPVNAPIHRSWIIASVLGMLIGFLLYPHIARDGIVWQIMGAPTPAAALMVIGALCFAPIGILQGLLLRRHIDSGLRWVVSTIVGWILFVVCWLILPPLRDVTAPFGLPIALGNFVVLGNIFFNLNVVTSALIGFSFGIVQWVLVLRGRVSGAYRWIIVSTLAYSVAITIASRFVSWGSVMSATGTAPVDTARFLLAGLSSGLIIGGATGLAMQWLLNSSDVVNLTDSDTKPTRPEPAHTEKSTASVLTLRNLLRMVGFAVIAVIVFDHLLGLYMAQYFPETPLMLNTFSATIGLDKFWEMTRKNRKPVVFTGSSSTFQGISPFMFDEAFLETTGIPMFSVNGSIAGGVITQARDMIRDIFIPNHPSAIFYQTEIRAFRDNPSQETYRKSPLGSTLELPAGLQKDIGLWLFENSSLFRYRNNLYDLLTGQRELKPELDKIGFVDERGHYPRNEATAAKAKIVVPNEFSPMIIYETHKSALLEIVSVCHQSEARCIIVHMPIYGTLYASIKPDEMAQFNAMLQQAVEGTHVALWNFNTDECRAVLGAELFADPVHLNIQGSARFSQMLAALYAAEYFFKPLPTDSPARCAIVLNR